MGDNKAGNYDADLDALLDDALNDFEVAPSPSEKPLLLNKAARSSENNAHPIARDSRGGEDRPKRRVFDPLAIRSQRERPPNTATALAQPPETEDALATKDGDALSVGLSKLLAELAAGADEDVGGAAVARSVECDSTAANAGDLGTTLRALAEQNFQFPEEDGDRGSADMLEKLMSQLGGLNSGDDLGGDHGEGVPGGMGSLVDVIMQQLLSKDVLYQPMKDIGARYPEWLQENREKLEAEDVTRYEQQQEYIQQICELYETEPENFSKLMELIQEMQQRGQPPQEIVDELAPRRTFGPDGLPTPGDCGMQ